MESRILKGESNICAIFHVFLIYRVITSSFLSLGRRSLKAVAELSLIFPWNAKLKEKITVVCSQLVVCVYSGENTCTSCDPKYRFYILAQSWFVDCKKSDYIV